MTEYKKGMVVLVLFPNSDLITAKRRPALIVQADNLNTGLDQVVVAMITSNLNRDGHPSRFRINRDSEQGKSAGILTDSVIMADNLATVRFKEIDKTLGTLPLLIRPL
ncbi:MAG: type II toxin-antitoxin system PemK/MazF family toxin [Nitrospirae bacterium]|nr:type II toxin-antitoxin system PemK/MazF family toxin [Nitrospirota bacterium]